jgi:hypothetical protein
MPKRPSLGRFAEAQEFLDAAIAIGRNDEDASRNVWLGVIHA